MRRRKNIKKNFKKNTASMATTKKNYNNNNLNVME